MTKQELRVFLDSWFCGCGMPEAACASLQRLLSLHPLYEHRKEFEALIPDDGVQYLLLYTLDHFDLTEHGGNVGGAWLTDKGKQVLEALNVEAAGEFDSLVESCCIHGYSILGNEDCPHCG